MRKLMILLVAFLLPLSALDVDVRLVNGYPDPANSSYMSLKNIVHDGLVTYIKYEGNMILHLRDTSYVGVRVDSMLSYGMSSEEYIRSFEYYLPAATSFPKLSPDHLDHSVMNTMATGSECWFLWQQMLRILWSSPTTHSAA